MLCKLFVFVITLNLFSCASSDNESMLQDNEVSIDNPSAQKGSDTMSDLWYTFPTVIGEAQAWITYNHGYAEVANGDLRNNLLIVKLPFKNPTEFGMPTREEFPQLLAVDEALQSQFTQAGGVYAGRVTFGGNRYFYFYLGMPEEKAAEIVGDVSVSTSYSLPYFYEPDKDKQRYWKELYPTDDDWQVIEDLKVLDALAKHGNVESKEREVMHWAYFSDELSCNAFAVWAKGENYKLHFKGKDEDGIGCMVKYSHIGPTRLAEITTHTIKSNRKAKELGGRYDGWETKIEK